MVKLVDARDSKSRGAQTPCRFDSDLRHQIIIRKVPISMKKYLLQVIIEQDEDGVYVASCPALEGCYTQGDTYEEAMRNVKDVIQMCLEELKEEKKRVDLKHPEVIGLKWVEVTI